MAEHLLRLQWRGDESVGIHGYHMIIELGNIDLDDREYREGIRKAAVEFMKSIDEDFIESVLFDDECGGCHNPISECQCGDYDD